MTFLSRWTSSLEGFQTRGGAVGDHWFYEVMLRVTHGASIRKHHPGFSGWGVGFGAYGWSLKCKTYMLRAWVEGRRRGSGGLLQHLKNAVAS